MATPQPNIEAFFSCTPEKALKMDGLNATRRKDVENGWPYHPHREKKMSVCQESAAGDLVAR
jgi:hypothetical protein